MMAVGSNVTALYPYGETVGEFVSKADLVIGAVLVTGARAPHVISREMISSMNEGAVVVDISVDQGGCVETTRPTTYADPTYQVDGVTHFAVTNMPGAVPRTSSQALSATILPYVQHMARPDWEGVTGAFARRERARRRACTSGLETSIISKLENKLHAG